MPQVCWCGNADLKEYSEHYRKCTECHTLVSTHEFGAGIYHVKDEDTDLYGKNYWEKGMLERAGVTSFEELEGLYLRHRAIYWLAYLLKYCLPPANIAEIGGGLGYFSYLMKQAGFRQVGYEMSPDICEYSRSMLGIYMICGDFAETEASVAFDSIAALDLIEHILKPEKLVKAFAKRITESGVLCLQTPCYDENLTYEQMLEHKPRFLSLLVAEEHIYLYSKPAIVRLLKQNGFSHIVFEPAVFGDDYDMFFFASKSPLRINSPELISEALSKLENGRLIKAIVNVFNDKQELYLKYQESEEDRGKRLALILDAEKQIKQIQEDKASVEAVLRGTETTLQNTETALRDTETTLQNTETALRNTETTLQNTETALRDTEVTLQNTKITLRNAETTLQNTETALRNTESTLQNTETALRDTESVLQSTEAQLTKTQREKELLLQQSLGIKSVFRQLCKLLWKRMLKEKFKFTNAVRQRLPKRKRKTKGPTSSLKIAIDVTPVHLDGSIGGVMGLTIELIRGLSARRNISILLLTSFWNTDYFARMKLNNVLILEMLNGGEEKASSEVGQADSAGIIRTDNPLSSSAFRDADLLFCPFGAPSFHRHGIPVVSTVNDIQHEYYPQFFAAEECRHRTAFYQEIVRKASGVICISDYTKATFCEKYGFDSKKTHTVYVAIQDRLAKSIDPAVLQKYGLENDGFILYPANFWEHKNHRVLLMAFVIYLRASSNTGLKLVLTGNTLDKKDYYLDVCKELGIADSVIIAGYVSQEELQSLMGAMKGLCFPSLFEGFGIPVVEAMCFDKPVACSNTTSLAEIGGECVYYFDPTKPDEVARGLLYLAEASIDEDMRIKYREKLKEYDFDKMISAYLDVFYEVVNQGDAGASDSSEIVSGVYGDRWSEPGICFSLYGYKGAKLHMDISLPEFLRQPRKIVLEQNGRSSAYEIGPGQALSINEIVRDKDVNINLTISPPWIPAKEIGGEDDRELGVLIDRAALMKSGKYVDLLNTKER